MGQIEVRLANGEFEVFTDTETANETRRVYDYEFDGNGHLCVYSMVHEFNGFLWNDYLSRDQVHYAASQWLSVRRTE